MWVPMASPGRSSSGGVSDTTPAMWRGTLVFARKAPGHGRVSQIMLSMPRHRSHLVTLPHGAVPEGCPHREGCREFPPGGEVQALSIDAQIVAFVWKPEGPGVGIDGAWEERVDSLANRFASVARFRDHAARPPTPQGAIGAHPMQSGERKLSSPFLGIRPSPLPSAPRNRIVTY